MKRINVITIDGPAASGKGSLAISIANQFSLKLLDSGSLYRLFAFFERNTDYSEIVEIIKNRVEFKLTNESQNIILDKNVDITHELKSEEVAKSASKLSSQKEVRNLLLKLQRDFYQGSGLVADGRDMGTVVFNDAKLKIFLTASPEVRAKRRYIELQNRKQEVNMPALIDDIKQRDLSDSTRDISPLLPADDAHIIDSSDMSLEEVFSYAEDLIRKEFI
jgi:cytidylate kinase|tara:strand:+ start:23517 stop:24176 length:660 start_codon:yes stop_codon:yes gene_type:complete